MLCEATVPLEDGGVCLASDDVNGEAGLQRKFQSLVKDIVDGREIGDIPCSLLGCDKLSDSA